MNKNKPVERGNHTFHDTVILGGGVAGLTADFVLTKAGIDTLLIERDVVVGGLARTLVHKDFRFDLGGHRFITKNKKLEQLVKKLLGDELLVVPRSSKILLNHQYFDYPLKPGNALFGLGAVRSLQILASYLMQQLTQRIRPKPVISFEDWVVQRFGRTLFNIFFRDYSEKVWGIPCDQISAQWASDRIQGLSLGKALKSALFGVGANRFRTLTKEFFYPSSGIGRISDTLKKEIEKHNLIFNQAEITAIHQSNNRVERVTIKTPEGIRQCLGKEFISSIPLTTMVRLLSPSPPADVLNAATQLKFRALVVVTIMLDTKKVTDQTWIYFPSPEVPFGRIHEPTNWSDAMAPAGKTHLVSEYFCFAGDATWSASDSELTDTTVNSLVEQGFIQADEVIDSVVLRVPCAYPVFDLDYLQHYEIIRSYLDKIENLHLIGRGGRFRYDNSDQAMESGMQIAEEIIAANRQADRDEVSCSSTQVVSR